MTGQVEFQIEVDEEEIHRQKARAKRLRESQWWKNKRASGVCHYCRVRAPAKTLTMDHVVPIIRGGKSIKSNLVPCCKDCNDRKKYLLPVEWEEYLGWLTQRPADQ
ncbi:MAG: HNH endonuclease [bacterium]